MIGNVLNDIATEYQIATDKFGPFHSAHEGLGIIREEYKELEEEIFKQFELRDNAKLRKEAIHLATMAVRFIIDVCKE